MTRFVTTTLNRTDLSRYMYIPCECCMHNYTSMTILRFYDQPSSIAEFYLRQISNSRHSPHTFAEMQTLLTLIFILKSVHFQKYINMCEYMFYKIKLIYSLYAFY